MAGVNHSLLPDKVRAMCESPSMSDCVMMLLSAPIARFSLPMLPVAHQLTCPGHSTISLCQVRTSSTCQLTTQRKDIRSSCFLTISVYLYSTRLFLL